MKRSYDQCPSRRPGEFHGGVAILDGKIVVSGSADSLPSAQRTIAAEGRCLLPGLVDTHCHLGVAYPYADDMRTESAQSPQGLTTFVLYIRNKQPSYIPFYRERCASECGGLC